ncbi:hypothetical protein LMBV_074 [Largemouth bass virus]|uniref:Uncharacterized protein n=1 Tax=Largemouth bass virus TaxID=176656 RepID=A0A9X7TNW4_9VIRU|nr:hypothetical protein OA88_23100 [Flavobacterium sp. JRM]QJE49136.1 hypothetical protein LMBV_073 [Largemouth bass virus]QJE49223.1 hypothetical protein LMBV_074 [Largemouth bass virus]
MSIQTLVQAYLTVSGKIAEFKQEIKQLRVEEGEIVQELLEAMRQEGIDSIRVADKKYIVLKEKERRRRSKQTFYEEAEMEGFDASAVDKLMSLSRGKVVERVSTLSMQKCAPSQDQQEE